eukprot:COSAG02_NODE_2741_length_8123_cov_5.360793_1_plen_105_part_00
MALYKCIALFPAEPAYHYPRRQFNALLLAAGPVRRQVVGQVCPLGRDGPVARCPLHDACIAQAAEHHCTVRVARSDNLAQCVQCLRLACDTLLRAGQLAESSRA